MQSSCLVVIFATILLAHVASSQEDGPTQLKFCTSKKTISLKIFTNPHNDDVSCQCSSELIKRHPPSSATRPDYVHTPGIGSHKLHTDAKSWNDARKICVEEGGHLAIINSRAEEAVLVEMLKKHQTSITNGANTEEAFLGVHDFFKEGDWVTIFGNSLYTTGYAHWSPTYWGGQPDNKDKNQNCAALIYQGGMDDVHCHERFAFFCEMPLYCA